MMKSVSLFILLWFGLRECYGVYQDRPKIKTSNGDLILEAGANKNIYLRTNGPQSTVFLGDVSLLNITGSTNPEKQGFKDDVENYLNGPKGILSRISQLERENHSLPSDVYFNISDISRRLNRQARIINLLRSQIHDRKLDECQSRPCRNAGTCLNLATGYYCLCPSNWQGENCDVDVDECRNFAGTDLGCQNGGVCINKPGSYECQCKNNWIGVHCTTTSKDCSGGNYETCGHGTCINNPNTKEGITCICDQGWTKNASTVSCIEDVDECTSSHGPRCSANPRVECINLPGSFRCGQCPSGYEGDGYVCSDIDECTTVKPNGGCSPMVSCHNTIGSRICGACPPGYLGDGITCTWRGTCNVNRGGCHPSAQCIDNAGLGGPQCICPRGMVGDGFGPYGCYIKAASNETTCQDIPCVHGQCHTLRNGYMCMCYRGYSGARCDVAADYCASNPCLHGGSCKPDASVAKGFRCECTTQYTGDLCHIATKTCGDLLQAEEGNIVYPSNNNTNYIHNARCAWVIQTARDKVINVTFSKFNLESSPECLYDFLQIHDGRNPASNMIGRFCGDTLPNGNGNIISSHNKLYFWFRSDMSVAKDGFALHWTSIDPVCGGTINATAHGILSSPGSPGTYPPNRDCYWHLTTNLRKRIQINFYALDIETHSNCNYDYLAIYDGPTTSDSLLAMYCNSTQPAPIQSAGSELVIHFHSDQAGTGKGFQISFTPIEGIPGCGGLYTEPKGLIVAPSLNGRYLTNLYCEYKIRLVSGFQIRLNFKSFKLEASVNCQNYDYLKVYDGPSSDSRLFGRYCGNTFPKSLRSSSNTLFIIFKTDSSISVSEGFTLTYEPTCIKTIYGDSGVVKSIGYPLNYPKKIICEYIIGAAPGKSLQLVFQDFDVENSGNCFYDYVAIRDGPDKNSTLMGSYCGRRIPPIQTSTHNYMHLEFVSDISNTGTGFYANYTSVDIECGGIFKENNGVINHPNSNENLYKNYQTCTWIIIAPEGMHIQLKWNKFRLENKADFVELVEFDKDNGNNTFGKFSGSIAPPVANFASNKLMLIFKSDGSVTREGFSVTYTFLDENIHCSSTRAGSHGVIYPPGWPDRYERNRDCVWIIIAPPGQRIKLNISQFDVEGPIRGKCTYGDYLEIRNGRSVNASLINQYCGTFTSRIVISTGTSLYIRFHSDSYISGKGFMLEWDSTVVGCGGTLTSATGSIASPNYPEIYDDSAECFYKIITSAGSRLHINFKDIDLEKSIFCRNDYLEIYDGDSSNANKLGRYCNSNVKSNSIETTKNIAFIKFTSDFSIGGRGFLLDYTTGCQNNLTGFHGVIESPGYPDTYALSMKCLWTIHVPKGNKINVTIVHLDIAKRIRFVRPAVSLRQPWPWNVAQTTDCSLESSYLEFKETADIIFRRRFCGNLLEYKGTTFSSTTNELQVNFETDRVFSYPRTGFRLEWARYGCGRIIRKKYGYISVDKMFVTSEELECEWLIESSPGTRISLRVIQMNLQDSQNCTVDSIEVYNGQSVSTPLITKFCHQAATHVQSTTNLMLIKLIKKSSLRDTAFLAYFDTSTGGCGGIIESSSGIITSKNYPQNYDYNSDCMWTLVVPKFHRVELKFIDFDLYSERINGTDCGHHIKIFDGEYVLNKNYSQLICPNSQVSQIVSKSNMMGVQFISNSYGQAKGFKANFTVTCGSVIIAKYDGIITNDNMFNHYDINCTWTINAPSLDKKITLTITHISLPRDLTIATNRRCPSSFLRVLDGNDENAPPVGEYCGREAPPTIVSRGSSITIQFGAYNNSMVTGKFAAHYTSLTTACGGTLTSEKGSIASPRYPLSYPGNSDCEWTLNTSPGNRVYITFEVLQLDYSDECNEDYIEVRENNGAGTLLGLYCGNEIPINTTAASKLYIKFHSDGDTTGRGFLLHYGFLPGSEIIGKNSGEITSPLYPHAYDNSGEYTWRVITDDKTTIIVTVDKVVIPMYGDTCLNSLIIYDGYDAEAAVLDEYCGSFVIDQQVLHTSSNIVFIKFKIDDSNSRSLFHISWVSSNAPAKLAKCGLNGTQKIERGQTIEFNSPNYPNHYTDNLKCEWVFETTPGNHLVLSFTDINMEETERCFADSISVYSAEKLEEWETIKENICLSSFTHQDFSSSTYVKVIFKTDSSLNNFKGFKAQIMSVCGGEITDSSGAIEPIWSEVANYFKNNIYIKCNWTVKVRPGRNVKLNFESFNISNTPENCQIYVILRNGDSAEAPMLGSGKYCGYAHENRNEIEASGNAIYVSFVSTKINNFGFLKKFRLRFEEKHFECGVSSKFDENHKWEIISSPNYPSIPTAYSECIWTFTGPVGEALRIDFVERFDLKADIDCSIEALDIRDGLTILSPSKGRFCGRNRPSTIKTSGNSVHIHYMTSLSEPNNGFKANVSIDVCGGTIVANSGEITSPGYPHFLSLPYGSVCEWRIRSSPRQVLKISPKEISLQNSVTYCGTKIVIEETLSVNNTLVKLIEICPENVESKDFADIETSSNEAIIKLHMGKSEDWTSFTPKGFRFTFTAIRSTCGGTITTSEGFLTTPGYPRESTLRYCQWLISVPDKTRRIRLEIIDADVQSHGIGIYNDLNFGTLITNLSPDNFANSTQIFESTGNKLSMYLWLNTRVSKIFHRFKARFSSNEQALCGGDLNGESGELTSPRLDRPYTCEWVYKYDRDLVNNESSNENKSIHITANINSTSISSYRRSECSYSDPKLTLKYNSGQTGNLFVQQLCGHKDVSITIPLSVLEIKASKSRQQDLDFRLNWKLHPCGGFIHVTSDAINILNFPNNHNDSIYCGWMITVPYESRVELKLEGDFQLDCVDEYVEVRQGMLSINPSIGHYCKDNKQVEAISTPYRQMFVQYHSKSKSSSTLKLMAKAVTNECGGILTDYNSIFHSPNYPKSYSPNLECTWQIIADRGSRINLQFFNRFFIETYSNCSKDAVIIYDWKDGAYKEMGRVCGRDLPPAFNSTSNKMKVVLRTDSDIQGDGFEVRWLPICGGDFTATATEQYIYSPGYPNYYLPMLDCTYKISSSEKILLKFDEFALEGSYPTCKNDNVTIVSYYWDEKVYCGSEIPIVQKSNEITIRFKTDSYIQRTGFKVSYKIDQCGGSVIEPTIISSGSENYEDNLNCTWLIEAPDDKNIILKFEYIDLETVNTNDCFNDYIAVFNGLELNNENRIAQLCGYINSSTVLRSNGNTMLLQFVTDYSASYTGFKVKVVFTRSEREGCGGNIDLTSTSSQSLQSPLSNGSVVYDNFLECYWTITAPIDYVIKLEFNQFHVASCSGVNQTALGITNCKCDLVEVTDGYNPNDLSMGSYCGHTMPQQLFSSKNKLGVRFSTDGEIVSSGFKATLSVQRSVCGQSVFPLTEKVLTISSPGYSTGSISRGLHCVYHFDMSQNAYRTVRLTIKNLDIRPGEPSELQCNLDKLLINVGHRLYNTSLGKDYVHSKSRWDSWITSSFVLSTHQLPEQYTLCGKRQSMDFYLQGSVTVDLQTSAERDMKTYKGFEIEVSLGKCPRNYTDLQGRIKYAYDNLPPEDSCYTLITAPENYTISLYVMEVIPDYWDGNVYLDIYDGNATTGNKLMRYSKNVQDTNPLFSTGRYLLLHSHNSESSRVAFDSTFLSTDKGRGCGGRLYDVKGQVSSPLYPNVYRKKGKCEWEIETPHGTHLLLHFSTFDLGVACYQNYVQLVDRRGNVMSTYCSEEPADYTSDDNYVKIVYTTTMNNGGTGWVADFIALV